VNASCLCPTQRFGHTVPVDHYTAAHHAFTAIAQGAKASPFRAGRVSSGEIEYFHRLASSVDSCPLGRTYGVASCRGFTTVQGGSVRSSRTVIFPIVHVGTWHGRQPRPVRIRLGASRRPQEPKGSGPPTIEKESLVPTTLIPTTKTALRTAGCERTPSLSRQSQMASLTVLLQSARWVYTNEVNGFRMVMFNDQFIE
jgi:hypothetical protein